MRALRGSAHPAGGGLCRGLGGHHRNGRDGGHGGGPQLRARVRHLPLGHPGGVPAGDRPDGRSLQGGPATGADGERGQAAAGRGPAAAGAAGAGARDRHLRRHPARGRRPLRGVPVRDDPVQQLRRRTRRAYLDPGHLSEPGEGMGRGGRRQKVHAASAGRSALLGWRAVHGRRHHVLVGTHRTDQPHLPRPVHAHHHLHRAVRQRGQGRRLHRAH